MYILNFMLLMSLVTIKFVTGTIKQKIPVKCNTAYEECHLRGQNATSTTNSEDPIYEKIH